jgi:two-component system, OmpR family, sensor histidine kinase MtrB
VWQLRRPTFGLRARATFAWALIALVLAAGVATISYNVTRSELTEERRERAAAQAYLNARLVRSGLRASDPDLSAILSSLEGNVGSSSLTRLDGEWFASSVGVGPDVLPQPLVEVVEAGDSGLMVTSINGSPHVVVGVPIGESSAGYYELLVLDDVDSTLFSLARNLLIGAAAATVAAALVGWYASGRILAPLTGMARAASSIAAGNLETRLDASGDPDLEPLQRSFNQMADAVEERVAREHRFTSDVSHELRGPVAAMKSSVEVARRHLDDADAVRSAIGYLDERTDALQELVVDLLEMSRMDAGVAELQLDPIGPAALVDAVVEMTDSDGVIVEIADDVPEIIVADKRRLGRSLMSLIENAAKYAGGATRIEVTVAGERIRFAVEDAGPGVPVPERRHVFGRFARGEEARSGSVAGSGLGLALVEEHLRLHGGSVHVDDAADGGARFVLELPIREVGA